MSATPALVVFARVPEAGAVKTRLTPHLSPRVAAELHAAFVGDALESWTRPGAFDLPVPPAVSVYVAHGDTPWPDGLAPPGVPVVAQRGNGLGARMLRAAVERFAAGHDRVVIIGTDHPTLPPAFIAEAFRALEERRTVVLGPADDGGYYLVGLNEVIPSLFEELTYGHPAVLAEALARAGAAGMNTVVLPPWYDVDTPADLARLLAERAGGVDIGQRAARVLDKLAGGEDRHKGVVGNDLGPAGHH